jgi:triosephosphate isomerase
VSAPPRVFIGNWKMHNGPRAARELTARFLAAYAPQSDRRVIICPPAISIAAVVDALATRTDVAVGAQNIWTEAKGAFTGETSAPMVAEAGGRYVLVGHSERRHAFGETNAETAKKCAIALATNLVPVLCVGEKIEQREAGRTEQVVLEQLRDGLALVADAALGGLLVAYEPVWAIGTGKTATPDDAAAVHAVLRRALSERAGAAAAGIPILYGGSVNATNARALMAAPNVNGLLVGGASLDGEGWATICLT